MKKNILKTCLILFIFLVFIGTINPVKADMGPKPSITVKITNMDTTDYLIDLLVYDETGEKYLDEANYGGDGLTNEQIKLLHNINYEGWISESTRWDSYYLFADCAGNAKFEHHFSYFGTPETYRVVIINNRTGEMRVSNIINRTEFTSNIELDVDSMNIVKKVNILLILKRSIIPLAFTIIVEVLIAFVMKIKDIKTVIFVNLITNIITQVVLIVTPISYMTTFILIEILVIILEYLIYKKYINNNSTKRIFIYTLLANTLTALLTFAVSFITAANFLLIFEDDIEGILMNIQKWWMNITS